MHLRNKRPLLVLLIEFHKKCAYDSGESIFEKERLQTLILKFLYCYMYPHNWETMFRKTFSPSKKLNKQIEWMRSHGVPSSCRPLEHQMMDLMSLMYPMYNVDPKHKHMQRCGRNFPEEKVNMVYDFMEDVQSVSAKSSTPISLLMIALADDNVVGDFLYDRDVMDGLGVSSQSVQKTLFPKLTKFREENLDTKIDQMVTMLKYSDFKISAIVDEVHAMDQDHTSINHDVLEIDSSDYHRLIEGSVSNTQLDRRKIVDSIVQLVAANLPCLQKVNTKKLTNDLGSSETSRLENLFKQLPSSDVLTTKPIQELLTLQVNLKAGIQTLKQYQVSEKDEIDKLVKEIQAKVATKTRLIETVDRSQLYLANKHSATSHDNLDDLHYHSKQKLEQLSQKISDNIEQLQLYQ